MWSDAVTLARKLRSLILHPLLEVACATLIVAVGGAILAPLLVPLAVWRCLAWVVAKWRYGWDATLVEPVELALGMSEDAGSDLFFLFEMVGKMDREDCTRRMERSVQRQTKDGSWVYVPRSISAWRFVLGYAVWQPEQPFDPSWHMVEPVDSATGKTILCTSDEEIFQYVKVLQKHRLRPYNPENKCPFRFYILRYRPPGAQETNSVMLCQIAHCFCDPYAAMNVFLNDSLDRDNPNFGPRFCLSTRPKLPFWQLVILRAKALNEVVRGLLSALRGRNEGSNPLDERHRQWISFERNRLAEGEYLAPRAMISPIVAINVHYLKDIKNVSGVSVATIAYLAFVRALARFCTDTRETKDAWEEGEHWKFRVMIPMSMWAPDETVTMRNNLSAGCAEFEARRVLDPSFSIALKYTEDKLKRTVMNCLCLAWWTNKVIFPWLPAHLFDAVFSVVSKTEAATITLPCLRCSEKEQSMHGNNIPKVIGCPGEPKGLLPFAGVLFSYNGTMFMLLTGSETVLDSDKQAKELLEMVRDEIYAMHRQLVVVDSRYQGRRFCDSALIC